MEYNLTRVLLGPGHNKDSQVCSILHLLRIWLTNYKLQPAMKMGKGL